MVQHRKTKTGEKIRAALSKLLLQKGFDNLTVSDITREAGINRGTFYAHYTDKFDLVEKETDAIIAELSTLLLNPAHDVPGPDELFSRQNVLDALRYVRLNRELIDALTDRGRNTVLQDRFKGILAQMIEGQIAHYPELTLSYHGLPEVYGREILLSSTTGVIWLWLRRGCQESPEELSRIVFASKNLSPTELLA